MKDEDKLNDFIQNNIDEFDDKMPSPFVWDKIKEEREQSHLSSGKTKTFVLSTVWYKVAAAILLMSNTYFAYLLTNKDSVEVAEIHIEQEQIDVQPTRLSPLYVEFTKVELVYQSQVSNKMRRLRTYQNKFPEVNQEVEAELKELSRDFNQLKAELDNEVMDEIIIQAMVENYQIRLQILEDILSQISTYNTKNIPHEINI